jgi:hypothetical protein
MVCILSCVQLRLMSQGMFLESVPLLGLTRLQPYNNLSLNKADSWPMSGDEEGQLTLHNQSYDWKCYVHVYTHHLLY